MKPIKNVFPASEGSEKWYSVNGGESTKMLIGRKWDKAGSLGTRLQLCPLFWIALTLFQRHIVLLEIVVLANSKKNRNIKAHDVNLISLARSTDFCFKTRACKYVFVLQIDRRFITLWKRSLPWTPLPLGISNDLPWGLRGRGGMDIFCNHSIKVDDGSRWKWMRLDKSGWKWMKVDRWIKVNENGWIWMTLNEDRWRWMIVNESETSI